MHKHTLTALKASIKHWEENVAAENPKDSNAHGSSCPLCRVFIKDTCKGCPVKLETGFDYCEKTPWRLASTARVNWFYARINPRPSTENIGRSKQKWRSAAQAELDFLKSLLPKVKK